MRWITCSLLLLLVSCTTEREWKQVASTVEIGVTFPLDSSSISKGARDYDMHEGPRGVISFHPFAPWEQPRPVYLTAPPPPLPTPTIEMTKPAPALPAPVKPK